MKLSNDWFQAKISGKRCIKVIASLNEFNINHIVKILKSVEISGVGYSYIDIAANPKIISIVRCLTDLPICVSSINPIELYKCNLAGADFVEIGNFDVFYDSKIFFSQADILQLVRSTAKLVPIDNICVTIPHILPLHEQIELVIHLNELGIRIIQTEGVATKCSMSIPHKSILHATYNAAAALSSTYTITKYTKTLIITSSGINALSAPIAISYGASYIGIGSALRSYSNIYGMANYLKEIVCSMSSKKNILFKPDAWHVSFVSISYVQI